MGGQQQERKSKTQNRKVQAAHRVSTANVCNAFIRGGCSYGDSCKFNHDITAFLASKPPDLPGPCPFESAQVLSARSSARSSAGELERWGGSRVGGLASTATADAARPPPPTLRTRACP